MKNQMKEWGRVCLGSVAGAALGAATFFAVDALAPQSSFANNTNVRDMLNNAEMAWGMGDNQTACLSIQIAIQSTSLDSH